MGFIIITYFKLLFCFLIRSIGDRMYKKIIVTNIIILMRGILMDILNVELMINKEYPITRNIPLIKFFSFHSLIVINMK